MEHNSNDEIVRILVAFAVARLLDPDKNANITEKAKLFLEDYKKIRNALKPPQQ